MRLRVSRGWWSTSPSATAAAEEITDAVRSLLIAHAANGTTIEELAETLEVEHIAEHLYTKGQPDPDLVIGPPANSACRVPAVAECAQRVLLLRGLLARLPARRLPAGPSGLLRAAPPLRVLALRRPQAPPPALVVLRRRARGPHRVVGDASSAERLKLA